MIDSHAHIISDDLAAFPPVRRGDDRIEAVLTQPFTAHKLLAAMDVANIEKALIVQRTQIYGFDNNYVCSAAQASNGRLAAVCGINAKSDDCGAVARDWHKRGAAGFRLMARPGDPEFNWLAGGNAEQVWQAASDLSVPMCVHFFGTNRTEGLTRLFELLEKFAIPSVIVDHLSNPKIISAEQVGIDDLTKKLAVYGNVALKFTSIPLNSLKAQNIDAGTVLEKYIGLFGEDRLIWGSDITQSEGSYSEMVSNGREPVTRFTPSVQQKLLHDNVKKIYQI